MISTDAVGAQIGGRLSNVKPVIPGVLRGERTDAEGHPYAIYYFVRSNDLKDWADHLEQRQDEIIGPSYFETSGDLRWNHYLYLLTSKEAALGDTYHDIKRVIEGDRSYARKFVLTEEELPEALKSLDPSIVDQQRLAEPDVVGQWSQRLLQAQLGVVLDQHSVAETVRKISKGSPDQSTFKPGRERTPRTLQPLATKFLDSVELVHFREWPGVCRVFETLGTVNLIVGSNGSGKTTLLEAIEYLYCQENARSSSPRAAHVKAKLKDMTIRQETRSSAKTAEAKQRNLDWYGQRDLRGSTLPNSFARFNFLSTDEAAMLGRKNAKVSFEDMLSQLVAGPQAAELWDHISRLGKPLEA
ncbi:MAG: AAA family ATPase [Sedimenticola sp.]